MGRETRPFDREDPSGDDFRSEFQRDRDRILYSSAFRRLGGVTQVISASEGLIIHNRLTHSLKVAQVARRLAERLPKTVDIAALDALGGLDPDVAEAAALAHDLGHPPFGHIAEEELDSIACNKETPGTLSDGFEGNAQSFRIVVRQSVRTHQYSGLNLTRATLNAILKYPWLRDEGPAEKSHRKWGAYQDDAEAFDFARKESQGQVKSLEAEIMDWADDIAYALHDTEDFHRAGLIPLERVGPNRDREETKRFLAYYRDTKEKKTGTPVDLEQATKDLAAAIGVLGPQETFMGSTQQRHTLRGWVSNRIGAYVGAFHVTGKIEDGSCVKIPDKAKRELDLLKHLTWYYVIKNPALATQQEGQRRVVKGLFEIFRSAITMERLDILPHVFRDRAQDIRAGSAQDEIKEQRLTRLVVDLVATMTEVQALQIYHKLAGIDPGSALDQLLHQSIG